MVLSQSALIIETFAHCAEAYAEPALPRKMPCLRLASASWVGGCLVADVDNRFEGVAVATMVDVAELAGVSTSTVSHVLNGTRHVGDDARSRVLAAIASTGYRQDALARALRRSKTDSIGLVLSDAGEPAFADMAHGVEMGAAKSDLTLLLANSSEQADRELAAVRTLLERRVDGLILARAADSSDDVLDLIREAKVPLVLLDRLDDTAAVDQVGAENRESMHRLVAELTSNGYQRFALIAGDTRVPSLRERREGFFEGVEAHGLHAPVVIDGVERREAERMEAELRAALREGACDCVIACSTPLAALALSVIRNEGLSIPDDVGFAVYDGFPYPDLFEPALTTVRQHAIDMGREAVDLLTRRIASPDERPRTVRLRQDLEVRDSTRRRAATA